MPAAAVRLLPGGQRTSWAGKRCRSLSLSDRGWELLTSYAQDAGLNRSEWLERCLRQLSPQDAPDLPTSPDARPMRKPGRAEFLDGTPDFSDSVFDRPTGTDA